MGAFINFVNEKLKINEEVKKVSSTLLKNVIDILKEYILTEYDLSEDQKLQIVNNMDIGVEEHDKGILTKGPRFLASSYYDEGEGKKVPVEITVEIVTEKIGQKQGSESSENTDVQPNQSEEAPEVPPVGEEE